jgi:ribosomal protein S18 acetylase RimI-like enzyme
VAETSPNPSKGGESAKSEVIGFALWYKRYSTWKGQRMYLEDLLVTNAYRGKGVGKLLLDTLLEEAKQQNFSGIMWQVLDWNEPAINFYNKYPNITFDEDWINCSINL